MFFSLASRNQLHSEEKCLIEEREERCGFKPETMAQRPISSVLEKIRRRKMEVSKKVMVPGGIQHNDSVDEIAQKGDRKDDFVFETLESRPEKVALAEPVERSAVDANPNRSPVTVASEDQHCLTRTSTETHLEDKAMPSFRASLNDTQVLCLSYTHFWFLVLYLHTMYVLVHCEVAQCESDLFSDAQTSETLSDQSKEEPGNLAEEHAASSLPSLLLKFDSPLPDDISSDKEECDAGNVSPHPQTLFKGSFSTKGDPVKEFVDEEALEDDSDNDILQFEDEDECDNVEVEEVRDYIAADYKEKPIDYERRHELHQMWLQQQDEAGTENLMQRLKYGTNQREHSALQEEDDDRQEDESDDDDDDTGDLFAMRTARLSTKKLKHMIPQMFTDKDDGFVSSEDEETERKLSKQCVLQKVALEQQPRLFPPAMDETSKEVFGRIKKLNTVPEPKKKAKTSRKAGFALFNLYHSSFLRRSSSHTTASHRTGPSTGRSFIFGRDDSNSRSSISLSEDSSNMSQRETHAKKNAPAKFISSQAKRSTAQAEIRGEVSSSSSLFQILRHSSMLKGNDTQDNRVDHHDVFAAFKPVKKRIKTERRS
ncbi:LOW QUALITY PROTEIN: hypothetical protein Cgig2_009678 [Carnegiea gigantea]|uniref:Uncharacterized protein n=1 Tax=Carnegiea gigantea TaxID=171969 RepID=A0A9Q1GHL3_9CARY|nr:LOW QUALITY PROTEIN: hypothetical protein Cgig2_029433 [Carnegiea gigantea]KAJ8426498.1 LOW QUALITY PROTEIN: hypothetical protein Cgig2_009678 [Carnegiea gigantea]